MPANKPSEEPPKATATPPPPPTPSQPPATISSHAKKIPLHVGSSVFVYKQQLIDIYVPQVDVYVARLAELVFGRSALIALHSRSLGGIDETLLRSLISEYWL